MTLKSVNNVTWHTLRHLKWRCVWLCLMSMKKLVRNQWKTSKSKMSIWVIFLSWQTMRRSLSMVLSELLFLKCTAHQVCSLIMIVVKLTLQVSYCLRQESFLIVVHGLILNLMLKILCMFVLTAAANYLRLRFSMRLVMMTKKFLSYFMIKSFTS